MSLEPSNAGAVLPDAEWKFGELSEWLAPGEWSVFINFEFGRIYRPLVEDVLRLRRTPPEVREVGTQPDLRPALNAARFWSRYFPEFPSTPYSQLNREDRRRRLDRLGLDSLTDPYHETAIFSHDPDVFCSQIGFGDLSLDLVPGLRRRLLILEIDPTRSRKLLHQQAIDQVDKKLRSLGVDTGEQFREPGSLARQNTGQAQNGRVVATYAKYLAALRLVSNFSWDWENAEEYARTHGCTLYAKKRTPWDRAYKLALCLLRRFETAWKIFYWPEFILDPSRVSTEWTPVLAAPLPSQDEAPSLVLSFESDLRKKILTPQQLAELMTGSH